ncbi:MAG TPA: nitrilase-related carbon-nitrogen hydrolase [Longimicrobiales bacterium]|nr:nitrilase-related carbon-nitrogen hydrolase [Longimicrobiales bacterium]
MLRLAVAQTAPVARAVAANAARIDALAASVRADLMLTPELSLTGYDVGDSVHTLARRMLPFDHFDPVLQSRGALVVGVIEAAAGGPFNTATVLQDGVVLFRHRKIYLPTYGMFDEARWFGRGTALETFTTVGGWRVGILICEDFWHPGLVYVLAAARRIDVLLVQAAAPGRGVWSGGEHGAFASATVWERMVRTTAQLFGIYVALANRVGVEGGVTFAGGSIIAAPDGALLARAPDAGEEVIMAECTRDALRRAHTPYAHARDDDPLLVLRELDRALEEQR